MDSDLKARKEQFVTGFDGSSLLEVTAAIMVVPLGAALCSQIRQVWSRGMALPRCVRPPVPTSSSSSSPAVVSFRVALCSALLDLSFTALPFLAVCLQASQADALCLTLLALNLALAGTLNFTRLASGRPDDEDSKLDKRRSDDLDLAAYVREAVSSWRSSMMMATCVCILAVDFTQFPRRFCKTETYGTGLMDIGTGSFVLANAVVSREARGVQHSHRSGGSAGMHILKSGGGSGSRTPLVLAGLGAARLITTLALNYQVHIGEYGAHWNFFFTLAAVAALTRLARVPARWSGGCGLLLMCMYQSALSSAGLGAYLADPARGSDLFSLNKEGICSAVGFWSLHLVGTALGRWLFSSPTRLGEKSKRHVRGNKRDGPYAVSSWGNRTEGLWLIVKVWLFTILLWSLLLSLPSFFSFFSTTGLEAVSRRSANLPYCLWTLAVNLLVIVTFLTAQFISGRATALPLLQAVNFNPLPVFLLANVATGVVNMTFNTMDMHSTGTWGIMVGYILLVSSTAILLQHSDIRLRF